MIDSKGYYDLMVKALTEAKPLTDAQKAELASELSNDPYGLGYAGKSASELFVLLHSEFLVDNPKSQYVDREYTENPDKLLEVYLMKLSDSSGIPYKIKIDMMAESSDLPTQVLGKSLQTVLGWSRVNMQDNDVKAQLAVAVSKDAVPQAFVDMISAPVERAGWTAKVPANPRIKTLFGPTSIVLENEIKECASWLQ